MAQGGPSFTNCGETGRDPASQTAVDRPYIRFTTAVDRPYINFNRSVPTSTTTLIHILVGQVVASKSLRTGTFNKKSIELLVNEVMAHGHPP